MPGTVSTSADPLPTGPVLVTGAAGFIGRHLVDALLADGHRVLGLDIAPACVDHPRLQWLCADFTDPALTDALPGGVAAVVHLASTTLPASSNADPVFDVGSNLVGAIRLLQWAGRSGVRRFVFASSGGTVYGVPGTLPVIESAATEPLCSYGIVKLAVEKYTRNLAAEYGFDALSLRLANPYGTHQNTRAMQGVVPIFCQRILAGEPLEIWGDGSVVRDFVAIEDVTRALLRALTVPGKGRSLNIGSGEGTSLLELIALIEATSGRRARVRFRPSRAFDVPRIVLDVSAAREFLGWRAQVSLTRGVSDLLQRHTGAPGA